MMEVAFRLDLPHGRCVGVVIPEALPPGALAGLPPEERAAAERLTEARRRSFVGGRVALRAALADLGLPAPPILTDGRGAPLLPAGAVGSISHKRTLAVGLAAPAAGQQIGVDVEQDAPLRIDVSRRVLTADEEAALAGETPEARARAVLIHLSAKESIYKALDPFVHRFVSFKEAALVPSAGGGWDVRLALTGGEGPFSVEVSCREVWVGTPFFLTSAAIRRA